jgi:hypothetical protein
MGLGGFAFMFFRYFMINGGTAVEDLAKRETEMAHEMNWWNALNVFVLGLFVLCIHMFCHATRFVIGFI